MVFPIHFIDAFTHQGFKTKDGPNHYNEDRVVIGTHVFAVIDGATAVVPGERNGLNASAYTSDFLMRFFHAHDNNDTTTAQNLIIAANKAFRTDLETYWPEMIKAGALGPSAALSLVKFHADGTLSYANMADCSCVIEKGDAPVMISHHYPRHSELDEILADAIFKEIEKGLTPLEARELPHVAAIIRTNRGLINVDYGVFNAQEKMVDFVRGGTLSADDVKTLKTITLLSDGMLWPEEKSLEAGALKAASLMKEKGVRDYYFRMKDMYDKDHSMQQFRRLKHMDDASALVIHLSV